MVSDPGYAVVVVLHVLVAVVAFGALGTTGAYARAARRSADPFSSATLARFFRPGHNLAARAIFLIPLLGAVLLGLSGDYVDVYPWVGLGVWTVAVGVASAVLWPAEAEIQRRLAVGGDRPGLVATCRRCEAAAALTSLLFVAALVVMVVQP